MVKMSMLFFWVVTPCRLAGKYQRLGETYCPSPHGVKTQMSIIMREKVLRRRSGPATCPSFLAEVSKHLYTVVFTVREKMYEIRR
jgi:hypothetical protein